jgi:hypothetical protein
MTKGLKTDLSLVLLHVRTATHKWYSLGISHPFVCHITPSDDVAQLNSVSFHWKPVEGQRVQSDVKVFTCRNRY